MTTGRDAVWHAVYAAAYVTFLVNRSREQPTDNDDFDPFGHDHACHNAHYDAECCADQNAETRASIAKRDAARKG